ncbi:MAG: DUF4390 domain-containing protein [Desulfobacterales bacterium]
MGRKAGVSFLLSLCLIWQFALPVAAEETRLAHMTVSNTRDDLLLSLTLTGAFTEKFKEAILSGVPATFVFYISIYRVRHWWSDKNIADIELTHTIKYDNLKKEFTVKRSWKEGNPAVTHSFSQAQQWMTEVEALRVFPLNELQKGRQYQIRTMAEVSKLTLPLYLHYILFSLWDVETDWYTIDFIY